MTLKGKGEGVKVFYNGKEKHFGSDIQTKEPILISRIARKRLIVVSKINEQLFAIRPRWKKLSLSTEPGEDSYIIVIIGTFSNNRDNDHAKWDKEVIEKVKEHKNVSMRGDGKKHNESFGRYFGLGMTAKCSSQNYGPFVSKPSKRKPEDLKLTNNFDILLKNEASQMHRKIDEVLPGFVKESFSVIQGVIDRFNAEADKSHEKVSCVPANGMIDDSCCTAIVCENAQTLKFHEEQDASYTFIGVPCFADNVGNKMDHYKFQFRWEACKEESKGIDIYLTPGTVISYSGMLIMHRQVKHLERNGMFYNLAMYHNKRLLCTMNAELEDMRKKEIKRLLTTRK